MRKFEKVSYNQFKKDILKLFPDSKENEIVALYDGIQIPSRATQYSSGYDFGSTINFVLSPNKTIQIPSGIKACMNPDEVLNMYVRSSLGFKYQVVLANSVGIIDSDFYENPKNEGHIQIKLINLGIQDVVITYGNNICQGVFEKYYITDDDNPRSKIRVGGIGSSGV